MVSVRCVWNILYCCCGSSLGLTEELTRFWSPGCTETQKTGDGHCCTWQILNNNWWTLGHCDITSYLKIPSLDALMKLFTTNWKILQEMGIPEHLTCLLRNLYAGQEATVRTGHGTTDGFQIGKGVCQAVYCHPAYLTYMQSTSWETLDWMKHKLESRLLGKISVPQICR